MADDDPTPRRSSVRVNNEVAAAPPARPSDVAAAAPEARPSKFGRLSRNLKRITLGVLKLLKHIFVGPYVWTKKITIWTLLNIKRVVGWVTLLVIFLVGQSTRASNRDPKIEKELNTTFDAFQLEPDNQGKAFALGKAIVRVIQVSLWQTKRDVQDLSQYVNQTTPEPTTAEKMKAYVSQKISDVLKDLSPEAKWAYGLTLGALMVGAMGLAAAWPSIRRRLLKNNKMRDVATPLDTATGRKQSPEAHFVTLVPYALSLRSHSKPRSKSKAKSKSAHK